MTVRRILRVPLVTALALALVAVSAAAQQTVSLLYTVQVNDGMLAEFEAAVAVHIEWRLDHDDAWDWNTFQVVNGANLNEFTFRSNNHAWSDFDAYAAFNAEASAHFRQVVSPYVESITSRITTSTDFVRLAVEGARPMYAVIDFTLRPGQTAAFLGALAQFHDAVGATAFPAEYIIETVINGGRDEVVRIIGPLDSWADMEEPSPNMGEMMVEHLGEDDALEVFEQFTSAMLRSESFVTLRRPDLSALASN